MCLKCDGIFNDQFITQPLLSPRAKICQHMPKLWAIKYRVVFLWNTMYILGHAMVATNAFENIHLRTVVTTSVNSRLPSCRYCGGPLYITGMHFRYYKRPGAAHAGNFLGASPPFLLGVEKWYHRWIQRIFLRWRGIGWTKWISWLKISQFSVPILGWWYMVGCWDPKRHPLGVYLSISTIGLQEYFFL